MKPRRLSRNLSLTFAFGLIASFLAPLPAQASVQEDCVNDVCTVTILYSGAIISWSPPSNARNLRFELFGGQGGKSGGAGGKVKGLFATTPEILYVAVGGAGVAGGNLPGGFNGGGNSGGGNNLEGSGGGATDIRSGLALTDRLAVAGGGGGRGSGLSANGATGGNLIALAGRDGQAKGGGGGTQSFGGAGGTQNGNGTAGQDGGLGMGGAGGTSSLFGGGGGAGGYYGGGGGGSDIDPCCTDTGGGGGGSSYTDPVLIGDVVHTLGGNIGNGKAIFSYQLIPLVNSITTTGFSKELLSAAFEITFNMPVTDFTAEDLSLRDSQAGCEIEELTGSGAIYWLTVSGCDDGNLQIAVVSNAVSNTQLSGPEEDFLSPLVYIDQTKPEVLSLSVNKDEVSIVFSEPVQNLDVSQLNFASNSDQCTISELVQLDTYSYSAATANCELFDYSVHITADTISDQYLNLGPTALLSASYVAPIPEPEPEPEPVPVPEPEPVPEANPEASSVADLDSEKESEKGSETKSAPDSQSDGSGAPSSEIGQAPIGSDFPSTPGSGFEQPAAASPPAEEGIALPKTADKVLKIPESLPRDALEDEASSGQLPMVIEYLPEYPAEPLRQAAQTVLIPSDQFEGGPSNSWMIWLSAGVFMLIAGSVLVSRRGLPEMLVS
jgi:hypothetical protein